jgi:hypothetical protein
MLDTPDSHATHATQATPNKGSRVCGLLSSPEYNGLLFISFDVSSKGRSPLIELKFCDATIHHGLLADGTLCQIKCDINSEENHGAVTMS